MYQQASAGVRTRNNQYSQPIDPVLNPSFYNMPELQGDAIYAQGNGMATVVSQRSTRNNTYSAVYNTRLPQTTQYNYAKDVVSDNKDVKVRKWGKQKVVVGNYKVPTWIPGIYS